MLKRTTVLCLFLPMLALAGCSLFGSGSETEQPPLTPATMTAPAPVGPVPGTVSPGNATPADASAVSASPINLVLWTTEDYAPTSDTAGGMRLLEQLRDFQQSGDVQVEVILKKRTGVGGLLDFLSTASAAAPAVLPDLITLSHNDLYRAAHAGLVQPLEDLLTPGTLDDQFDFARALTQVDGVTVGVLYQADLHHLVYDTNQVQATPASWQDVYSSTARFVFSPAPPSDGINSVILIQYLAAGGTLTDADGQPALNAERLEQALTFFQVGRQLGVIPRSVPELADATTAWATYRIGEAGMVETPASLFLAERAGLHNAGFGPVPLRTPGVTTVGQGWALALVTQDAERQRVAVSLIEHLLSGENSGAWTQAATQLPTRHAALDMWGQGDPYVPFMRNLLVHAEPAPNPELAAVVGPPLAQALADVLSGLATPREAAETAANAVEANR